MLRQLEIDHLSVRIGVFAAALFFAPQEDHQVAVLLQRSALPQIGQTRFLRFAHLRLARQLGERNDRNLELAREGLQSARDL